MPPTCTLTANFKLCVFYYNLLLFFLVGLGFELGFALAKQAVYSLNHAFIPFCFGYFESGSQELFPQAGLKPQYSQLQSPK
jgi:hypothetical protein